LPTDHDECCCQVVSWSTTLCSLPLAGLIWLPAAVCIMFKLPVVTYHCVCGAAPSYLSALSFAVSQTFTRTFDHRQALPLTFVPTRLATTDGRIFPVAAARLRNQLPGDITAAQSVMIFRHQQKNVCFHSRFWILPDSSSYWVYSVTANSSASAVANYTVLRVRLVKYRKWPFFYSWSNEYPLH
jgi:hypothetical protein